MSDGGFEGDGNLIISFDNLNTDEQKIFNLAFKEVRLVAFSFFVFESPGGTFRLGSASLWGEVVFNLCRQHSENLVAIVLQKTKFSVVVTSRGGGASPRFGGCGF